MAGGDNQYASALTTYNGDLIVGGYFTMVGTHPVNNIAKWNDAASDWEPLSGGVTNCCGYGAAVYTVAVANGQLFAGGWFGFGQDCPHRIIGWQDCSPTQCSADITGDQTVNVDDLLSVVSGWGTCADPDNCLADLDQSGAVDVNDLLAIIGAWGPCT